MDVTRVKAAQLEFYQRNGAGCAFAALAAKDPARYGWAQEVLSVDACVVDSTIEKARATPATTSLSLIFPEVSTIKSLMTLITILQSSNRIFLEQDIPFENCSCLGLRVRMDVGLSWISGFGPFDFFPATRRSPYTELAFRVKSRPNYTRVMKKTPSGVIHLADMDMLGLADTTFKRMWTASLERTAQMLGHKPDLRSAAKTTFSIPTNELIASHHNA